VKWVAVSLAVALLVCAGALVWQQREISELRRDNATSGAIAAAEARADALIEAPVGRWGYDVPVRDAARLVASLCSLSTADANTLAELTAGSRGEGYRMLTYLVGEFATSCEPRRHR
jgi:hypothetical protein